MQLKGNKSYNVNSKNGEMKTKASAKRFQSGAKIQLFSRITGHTLQFLKATESLNCSGSTDRNDECTHWTVDVISSSKNDLIIRLHMNDDFLSIIDGKTVLSQQNEESANSERHFRVKCEDRFVLLESLNGYGYHVGILDNGEIKSAIASGEEISSHFALRIVKEPTVESAPTYAKIEESNPSDDVKVDEPKVNPSDDVKVDEPEANPSNDVKVEEPCSNAPEKKKKSIFKKMTLKRSKDQKETTADKKSNETAVKNEETDTDANIKVPEKDADIKVPEKDANIEVPEKDANIKVPEKDATTNDTKESDKENLNSEVVTEENTESDQPTKEIKEESNSTQLANGNLNAAEIVE